MSLRRRKCAVKNNKKFGTYMPPYVQTYAKFLLTFFSVHQCGFRKGFSGLG